MSKIKVTDEAIVRKYLGLQDNAKARGIPFRLSLKKIRQLLSTKTCYFSKVPFEEKGPNQRTIDRIDSARGYVDDNVVACTHRMNQVKGNATLEEIKLVIVGVTKFKAKNQQK